MLKLEIATLFNQYELQALGETSGIPQKNKQLPSTASCTGTSPRDKILSSATSHRSFAEQGRPESIRSYTSTSVGHSEMFSEESLSTCEEFTRYYESVAPQLLNSGTEDTPDPPTYKIL